MASALEDAKGLLVRRWGEMAAYWGISRTMAEIHALLFVTGEPLCTDDVMAQLHVSRGNASMNLRGLVDWGLVQRVHKPGDRKEYFHIETDVWRMFETITRERRRREVEPIIATIDRCCELVADVTEAAPPRPGAAAREAEVFRGRLHELRDFLQTMAALVELMLQFGREGVRQVSGLMGALAAERAGARNGVDVRAPAAPRPSATRGRRKTRR